jgi:hypothetical protein
MKKLIILTTFLLLFSSLSALEINLEKSSFDQGSNFLATLQGNILQPIEKQDIGFFLGHIEQPIDFDFKKIDQKYYIYAILPYQEKNYTLKIQNVYFKENNKIQTQTLEKNFSISQNLADFYVSPGVAIAKENITLKFYNNLNQNLEMTYSTKNISRSFSLPLQTYEDIFIPLPSLNQTTLTNISLTSEFGYSYYLPIKILSTSENLTVENQTQENQTEIPQNFSLDKDHLFFPLEKLEFNISKNEQITYPLPLKNLGNNSAQEITFSFTNELEKYVLISPPDIEELPENSSIILNLTFKFLELGEFQGDLIATSLNSTYSTNLKFYVKENTTFTPSQVPSETCESLGYKKCEVCYGTQTSSFIASNAPCCIGSCSPPKEEDRNWTVIIIVIVIILGIAGFVIWKKRKPTPSAKDILTKRSKSFSDKFETSGSISKV